MNNATFSYRPVALLAIALAAIVLVAVWVPRAAAQTADEILDKMRRFGLRIQQVHGQ